MNDSSDYRLIFDLASHGYTTWHFALFPLVFAGVAIPMGIREGRARGRATPEAEPDIPRHRVAIAGGIFAGLVAIVLFINTWTEYRALRRAVAAGKSRTVVGTVTDFVPEDPGGHGNEHFRVGDVVYDYSTTWITPGFRQTAPAGGPIHSGARVRIADVDGIIVRLEIAR